MKSHVSPTDELSRHTQRARLLDDQRRFGVVAGGEDHVGVELLDIGELRREILVARVVVGGSHDRVGIARQLDKFINKELGEANGVVVGHLADDGDFPWLSVR